MKILIVGAGLSGLSTALALRKYVRETLDIRIYDRRDPHDTGNYGWHDHADLRLKKNQGAAISLQSNGIRVLEGLDPALADRVEESGFPCKGFTWKSAGDYSLGREYLDLLPISRPILVQCLLEFLPDLKVEYKTVTGVETKSGQKPVLHFDDGTVEEADLIIGADGIRSSVRRSIFPDIDPIYLGHCAVGGVLNKDILPPAYFENPTIIFIEGGNGFFGYSAINQADPKKILYFSIYDSELPDRRNLDYKKVNEDLRERYKDFADPVVQRCLQEAMVDNIYPICYLPDLPNWGRDGCVLVGDAAHAMTPASGQGGSQAFEDGQTLALLLAEYLKNQNTHAAIESTIKSFYEIRHARVDKMKADGLKVKEPERPWSLGMTGLVYVALFLMTKVKYILSFFGGEDRIRGYDVKVEVERHFAAR